MLKLHLGFLTQYYVCPVNMMSIILHLPKGMLCKTVLLVKDVMASVLFNYCKFHNTGLCCSPTTFNNKISPAYIYHYKISVMESITMPGIGKVWLH